MHNTLFLAAQAASTPTVVGGLRQWGRVGRSVRKGEHACGYIYVPKRASENAGDPTELPILAGPGHVVEGSSERQRFLLVPVFDVGQTDAKAEQ